MTSAPALAVEARRRREPCAPPAGSTLGSADASPEAKALYAYLWSIYGQHTLTGQQEQNFTPGGPRQELDYLQKVTGKLPALLGLDYIEPSDEAGVNERATAWHRAGGIATICWHWGAPDIGTGYENSKKDFDVAKALTPGTRQNILMGRQMAHVADLLTVLRDRKVPVLWRPFHEFSGDWFWWGKQPRFGELWKQMFDRFTVHHQLHNLLWVYGPSGQFPIGPMYPGASMVDLLGRWPFPTQFRLFLPLFYLLVHSGRPCDRP